MKFKKLPKTRMKALFDRVITVPIEDHDISLTISKLPRKPSDSKIVAIRLKRKLELKGAHVEEFISPDNVLSSLKVLINNGNFLYRNTTVNKDFLSQMQNPVKKSTNLSSDEEESDSDCDTNLEAVKKFQSAQNSRTCLMPLENHSRVVINTTKDPITEKVQTGK